MWQCWSWRGRTLPPTSGCGLATWRLIRCTGDFFFSFFLNFTDFLSQKIPCQALWLTLLGPGLTLIYMTWQHRRPGLLRHQCVDWVVHICPTPLSPPVVLLPCELSSEGHGRVAKTIWGWQISGGHSCQWLEQLSRHWGCLMLPVVCFLCFIFPLWVCVYVRVQSSSVPGLHSTYATNAIFYIGCLIKKGLFLLLLPLLLVEPALAERGQHQCYTLDMLPVYSRAT